MFWFDFLYVSLIFVRFSSDDRKSHFPEITTKTNSSKPKHTLYLDGTCLAWTFLTRSMDAHRCGGHSRMACGMPHDGFTVR